MNDDRLRRLLVVDDEPSMCVLLRATLRGTAWRVDSCSCGEQALAALRGNGFDVVVIDRHLPGMTGIELARAIRAQGDDCALIMVTGLSSVELGRELVPLGFSALLDKPFESIATVTAALEQAYEQHRRRAQLQRSLGDDAAYGIGRYGGRGALSILAIGRSVSERRHLLGMLSRLGDRVLEAATIEAAPRLIAAFRPSVCLIDTTPDVEPDLAPFAPLIRAAPHTCFAVVMLDPTLRHMRQLMGLGVRGVLEAPVDQVQAGKLVSAVITPLRVAAAARRDGLSPAG